MTMKKSDQSALRGRKPMSEPPKKEPPPDWAVAYVRGAFRIGMHVPEIEQHLVSQGLSPEAANTLILDIVNEAVREASPTGGSSQWAKPVRLLLCSAIGCASLYLAYLRSRYSLGLACLWVVPALFSIWVPELTDTDESDWGARSWVTGWFVLLLYLCYRVFIALMWPS